MIQAVRHCVCHPLGRHDCHQHWQQHVHVAADLNHDDGQRDGQPCHSAHEGPRPHQGKRPRIDPCPGPKRFYRPAAPQALCHIHRDEPHCPPKNGADHEHGNEQPAADRTARKHCCSQEVGDKHDGQRAVVEAAVSASSKQVFDTILTCGEEQCGQLVIIDSLGAVARQVRHDGVAMWDPRRAAVAACWVVHHSTCVQGEAGGVGGDGGVAHSTAT
mmetsp:Transcript_18404/g.39567  ORF Transcript_18404/g.39567 Transcript_18404/m.39567 type:complete len:216 (-) Transcript_18404:1493-2140(-)